MKRRELNKQLHRLYVSVWPTLQAKLAELDSWMDLSYPLFLSVPPEYTQCRRVMVVGQEASSWGRCWELMIQSDAPAFIMKEYSKFWLEDPRYDTPFWVYAHALCRKLIPGEQSTAWIWNNLVKIASQSGRPDQSVENEIASFHLLEREIGILKPEVVVFCTGPSYRERLEQTFPGIKFIPKGCRCSQLRHPSLPRLSFETDHPKYLRLSKNPAPVRLIVEAVEQQLR